MSDPETTDSPEGGAGPRPDPWEKSSLLPSLAARDEAAITDWIETRISAGDWDGDYAAAAQSLASRRYFAEASRILRAAFASGTSPYDAPRALIHFWYGCGDAMLVAAVATDAEMALETTEFRAQGDAFHKGKARSAIADVRLLANIEAGLADPEGLPEGGIHGIAQSGLWKRIWMQHGSLQFASAQRLATAFVRLTDPAPAERMRIVATFFGWHGGAAAGLDLLEAVRFEGEEETARLVLAQAIAFEAGLDEPYVKIRKDLAAHLETQGETPDVTRAHATLALYAIREAMDAGEMSVARDRLSDAETRFGGETWAGVFALPAILLAGQDDLAASLAQARRYLGATDLPRSPFGAHILADIFARAGDWDSVYRLFEDGAAGIRGAYNGLTANQPEFDTAIPEDCPSSALVLSGWGLGDDVFRLGLLHRHFGSGDYTMMLDARLVAMARRARPDWRFLAHSRVSEVGVAEFWNQRRGVPDRFDPLRVPAVALAAAERHGAVMVQEDLQPIHAARKGAAPEVGGRIALDPDPARIREMRDWLKSEAAGRKTIGLCWRSGLSGAARSSSFFGNAEVARLTGAVPAAWVLMQYDWDGDEIADIEARSGMRFLVHPALDIRNDIEGVAALGRACELVMSTGVSTREICAAAGANVYSISFGWPWANAWRRDGGMRDTIFPSMMHCDPASRERVLEQAIEQARAEVRE